MGEDAKRRAFRAHHSRLVWALSLEGSVADVGRCVVVVDDEHPGRVSIEIREAESSRDGTAGSES